MKQLQQQEGDGEVCGYSHKIYDTIQYCVFSWLPVSFLLHVKYIHLLVNKDVYI